MSNTATNSGRTEELYQSITDRVIDLLEKVDLELYEPPFAGLASQGLPENPTTSKHYNGINIPFLWFYQQENGYTSNHWASFKQWQAKGAQVRKGEKGSQVIFYKTLSVMDETNPSESKEIQIPMLRMYKVFNANQVDGYDHETTPSNRQNAVLPLVKADQFRYNTKVELRHGGGRAYYSPRNDYIQMPPKEDFISTLWATPTENYYSVLFHELVHATSHPTRLDRKMGEGSTHEAAYAQEELVAELGSAFLSAQFNIAQTAREDHAMYVKSWLKVLKNDNKFIFKASAHAAKAVDYLNSLQPTSN